MKPPPFFVSFPSSADYRSALGGDVAELYWPQISRLAEARLPPVESIRALACLFGVSSRFIGAINRNPERYYRTFVIRVGKKRREIQSPKVALKLFQKWFGTHLSAVLEFDPHVFGFVPGRSAPQAAATHTAARWVYAVDLKDFFPNVSKERVVSALKQLGYSQRGASLVAALCCFRGGLAQGSPASPVLSNLVFREEDRMLAVLAGELDARLTRYADDIVFSGTGEVPNAIRSRVRAVVTEGGWEIHPRKEHLAELPQRLKVHGLVVHGASPRLTKGYRNRIRAFRHLLRSGRLKAEDTPRVAGHLHYADAVARLARDE